MMFFGQIGAVCAVSDVCGVFCFTHTLTHSHTLSHTLSHTPTHTFTHSHTHTHSLAHTRTHTHTHTHSHLPHLTHTPGASIPTSEPPFPQGHCCYAVVSESILVVDCEQKWEHFAVVAKHDE